MLEGTLITCGEMFEIVGAVKLMVAGTSDMEDPWEFIEADVPERLRIPTVETERAPLEDIDVFIIEEIEVLVKDEIEIASEVEAENVEPPTYVPLSGFIQTFVPLRVMSPSAFNIISAAESIFTFASEVIFRSFATFRFTPEFASILMSLLARILHLPSMVIFNEPCTYIFLSSIIIE